jgi:hypothetical protein
MEDEPMTGHSKHSWLMLACCLIPVVGFAVISIWQIPANTVILFILALLCPLSHLLLMKFMMNDPADHPVKARRQDAPRLEQGDL